jgi:hypothetical protein
VLEGGGRIERDRRDRRAATMLNQRIDLAQGGTDIGSRCSRCCNPDMCRLRPTPAKHENYLSSGQSRTFRMGHGSRQMRTASRCGLVNGSGWQGMAAPLGPKLQWHLRQLSSPGRSAHSSRGKKAALPPSSTCVPALRVQQFQAPAFNQPSRPRWARVRPD